MDDLLAQKLRSAGAVRIKGPKWCGKTATAEQAAASSVYLQDPDSGPSLLELARIKPSAILEGAEPRLIDEWQMAPQLWDAVRYAIDRGKGTGRFILTGSSTPRRQEQPKHSGVGRIANVNMRTMSLFESGESNGDVSLRALFDGECDVASISGFDIEDVAYAICRGGWPAAVTSEDRQAALDMPMDYLSELLDSDIEEIDGVKRNRSWMRAILRSYARNTASEAPLSTIAADMQGEPPSIDTVSEYVDALARACVLEDLDAWTPRLRSKTAVRTSPTRHFTDPSLAAAMLGATPRKLLADFATFGLLFESLCIRDLRIYVEPLRGRLFHYRDKTGLEADAVIALDDGRWAAIEVKLGPTRIDEAAAHLLKLAGRVDGEREGAPSFLMVLTSTSAAYRREDGVIVAPISTLRP